MRVEHELIISKDSVSVYKNNIIWEYKGHVQSVFWQMQITSLRMKVAEESIVDEFYSIFFMLYLCYLQKSTERENKEYIQYDEHIICIPRN